MQLQGRIVCFFQNRGYGFIKTPDEREYFFHLSNCKDKIALSVNVDFESAPPVREGRGPQAVNITVSEVAPAERKDEGGAL
jgi:cold shock CspA family protein